MKRLTIMLGLLVIIANCGKSNSTEEEEKVNTLPAFKGRLNPDYTAKTETVLSKNKQYDLIDDEVGNSTIIKYSKAKYVLMNVIKHDFRRLISKGIRQHSNRYSL